MPGIDFRLTHAVRLEEGLELFAAPGCDVVLLDLLLPDSQGIETFQKLNFHAAQTPLIVLTGLDDQSLAVQAAREGAQDYLIKGKFDSDLLVRSIRYAITRNRAQKRLTRALCEARTTAANLRSVIANNVDGMVVVDRHGAIRFSNPAAEALFGRSGDELLNEPFDYLVVCCESSEIEILRSDGVRVPVELRGIEVQWERQPAHLAMLRDLTFQKQAEKEREARLVQLEIAHQIQQQFLPHEPPALPGFDIAGALYPALDDYRRIDVSMSMFPIRDGQGETVSIGGIVRDITDREQARRAVRESAARYRSLFEDSPVPLREEDLSEVKLYIDELRDSGIEDVLRQLNRALVGRTNADHFVTMFLGRLDRPTRSFAYASAGHPSGYVVDRSGQVRAELPSTGIPLAIDVDAEFPLGPSVTLEPGDTVLLLTDGFLEARSPDCGCFHWGHVLEVLRDHLDELANVIIQRLHQAVREFAQREILDDDLTAVVIKVDA